MSDDAKDDDKPAAKPNRFKALVSAAAGLLSGAFMMYVSPLITKVVQPAKPIANFGVERDGLTVTFTNQSSSGGEGWLDFGDGSPLEPVASKQTTITHSYALPDVYTAKLTWRNLIGDENERSVKVELEKPKADPPAIQSLEAVPICSGAYAPATFRIVAKTKNAQLCVWDCGDERPLMFSTDAEQDQLVTFPKAGGYMVKLAAVNGEQAVEKSTVVLVDEPPPGSLVAVLSVTDQGTRVDRLETPVAVSATFPPNSKDEVYRFDRQVPARQGYQITSARMETVSERGSRNLDLRVATDHQSAHLSGELVKEGGLLKINTLPPSALVRVFLTQERRVPQTRGPIPVTGTLWETGAATLCLPPWPASWVEPQRQLQVTLRDGDQVIWQGSQRAQNVPVMLRGQPHVLTVTSTDSQVRIELAAAKGPPGASAP
jgi:PKD repeat protein